MEGSGSVISRASSSFSRCQYSDLTFPRLSQIHIAGAAPREDTQPLKSSASPPRLGRPVRTPLRRLNMNVFPELASPTAISKGSINPRQRFSHGLMYARHVSSFWLSSTDRSPIGVRLRVDNALCHKGSRGRFQSSQACLLYTSDAADDLLCVDLGG